MVRNNLLFLAGIIAVETLVPWKDFVICLSTWLWFSNLMTLEKPNYAEHFGFLISKPNTAAIISRGVDKRIKSESTHDKALYKLSELKGMAMVAIVIAAAQHMFCFCISLSIFLQYVNDSFLGFIKQLFIS